MQRFLFMVAVAALGVPLGHSQSFPDRTWTSSDGDSTFEGKVVSVTETEVEIRSTEGRVFDLDWERLSADDRTYLKEVLSEQERPKGLDEGAFADKITGEWVKVPADEYGILFQVYGESRRLKGIAEEGIPLFVHLHGASARGADVETGKVEIGAGMLIKEYYRDHPCLLVVPTCPADTFWGDHVDVLEGLIDTICEELPIDRSRIYLSGYSMGARGIGALMDSRPDAYAGALFADGEAKMSWAGSVDTALWLTFSGERDLAGAEAVAKAHVEAGKVAHFSGHPDHTHNQIHWTLAKTEGVYDWLFEKKLEPQPEAPKD